jgi:XrtN system VIT domain protein
MTQNKIQQYFTRPVRLFAWEGPAWIWMISSFGSIGGLAILVYVLLNAASRLGALSSEIAVGASIALAIAFFALFLIFLRSIFSSLLQFTVFTLILAGLSFAANAYVLSHEVFPPFTTRTEIALWITFAALGLAAFSERMPETMRYAFLPLLAFGAMLCIAFIIVLSPVMAFAWIVVWAGGLGFLPYSPLFAFIAFALTAHKIHRSVSRKDLSKWLILATVSVTLAYSLYYKIQWNRAEAVLQKPEIPAGHNRLDEDLPDWLQKAARMPVNHVSEMVLQPNRRSTISVFSMQSLFDPLAFLSSGGMGDMFRTRTEEALTPDESGRMLHLLFGQSHAYLDRLWSGHSLITTDIKSHVQIHPELRVAYTETTLAIYNEDSDANKTIFGTRLGGLALPEEAIYTITVPEGSICTKLSLWVDGEERPARLTFKSTAHSAYQQIVGLERRDPSYVEWLDGNRLRLRVFPVLPQQYRTVRIGIVSPLKAESGRLTYEPARLEGPVQTFADRDVHVDVYSAHAPALDTNGISLKEKIVPDGQVRQFAASSAREHWSFSLPAPEAAGHISAGGLSFSVQPLKMETKSFVPGAVLVALNGSLSRSQWKEFVKKLYEFDFPVYMLAGEWFHTKDRAKALAYLDECNIPAFNLFPLHFPSQMNLTNVIWVTAGEDQSIPLGELRDSQRFEHIQKDAASRGADPVAVLNGRMSEYVASLVDLDRLEPAALDESSLLRILRERRIEVPVETETSIPLRAAGLQLERSDRTEARPGSDLLVRIMLQRKIMRSLGQRFFNRDLENADLVKLARDGMIVSPVSTLIVLETEQDYKRFGIADDPSLLGQSKLEAPGGVPEPHETALLIALVSALLFYFYRRREMARV